MDNSDFEKLKKRIYSLFKYNNQNHYTEVELHFIISNNIISKISFSKTKHGWINNSYITDIHFNEKIKIIITNTSSSTTVFSVKSTDNTDNAYSSSISYILEINQTHLYLLNYNQQQRSVRIMSKILSDFFDFSRRVFEYCILNKISYLNNSQEEGKSRIVVPHIFSTDVFTYRLEAYFDNTQEEFKLKNLYNNKYKVKLFEFYKEINSLDIEQVFTIDKGDIREDIDKYMKKIEIITDWEIQRRLSISKLDMNIKKLEPDSENFKIFTDLKSFFEFSKLEYYLNLSSNNKNNIKVISHTDLHQSNILTNTNDELFFIDFEQCSVANLGSDFIRTLLFLASYESVFNFETIVKDSIYYDLYAEYIEYFNANIKNKILSEVLKSKLKLRMNYLLCLVESIITGLCFQVKFFENDSCRNYIDTRYSWMVICKLAIQEIDEMINEEVY